MSEAVRDADGGVGRPAIGQFLQGFRGSFRTPLLIAVIVLSAIGVIAYVNTAVKRIEDQLPLRVMQEKRDMERVARSSYNLLSAVDAALAHPTEGNVASIRDNLSAVEGDLATLRERYTFDTLIGASALHAILTPAIDDARIWLNDGFGALEPTSPVLLDLVATRIGDVMNKVYDKTTEADRIAYEILERQSVELRQLRWQLILLLVAVVMLAGGVIWLALRQQRIARDREAALQELNAVMDSIDYGVLFMGPDLRARIVNREFARIWNIPEEFIQRRPSMRETIEYNRESGLYDVAPADWDDWVERRVAEVHKGDMPPEEIRRTDGKVLSYQCVALPNGGRMITYFDITGLKEREAEITRARDAAEAALADLQKAQERLIQAEKMASLGQLTAGIAHEIKNPLNFVNNFSKLSDELLEELEETLEPLIEQLDEDRREDARDLFATVRENLLKIHQHGARADSIVKNMLLHAREGPTEAQRVSLNAIAQEALNLAYHGARAENASFNVDIERSLAADAGEIECFPQEIMRVLLNLISNGLYATQKRAGSAGNGYSPTIWLRTRSKGQRVEVEVRDNGNGIPADVQEKIFLPFFTTKPAGEGTGLGLSLSYDIVVKQHGGDLTVESEPGEFTAFCISLPRSLPAA